MPFLQNRWFGHISRGVEECAWTAAGFAWKTWKPGGVSVPSGATQLMRLMTRCHMPCGSRRRQPWQERGVQLACVVPQLYGH